MVNDTIDLGTEVILLDNIAATGSNHNGGDLDIGSDGYLYVGIGDAGTDPRLDSGAGGSNDAAQDLSILNGKIARITLDGDPAPGNPFSGPGTVPCATLGTTASPSVQCQEIYSWGLRNPYRFASTATAEPIASTSTTSDRSPTKRSTSALRPTSAGRPAKAAAPRVSRKARPAARRRQAGRSTRSLRTVVATASTSPPARSCPTTCGRRSTTTSTCSPTEARATSGR